MDEEPCSETWIGHRLPDVRKESPEDKGLWRKAFDSPETHTSPSRTKDKEQTIIFQQTVHVFEEEKKAAVSNSILAFPKRQEILRKPNLRRDRSPPQEACAVYPTPAMHQGCAFSLPPSVALGHAYGDHSLVPDFLGPTRGPAKAQHMFRQSTTTQAAELAMTHYREATWQPMAYRSTHLLSGRRWKKRGRQQRQQAAAGNPRPEDAGTETSPGQRPRQRKQQQQRQEQQQQAPDASDEDLVVLDDPFEELEGNRRRHLCVVHDALAAGPTPYNEGWEWQKQALARLAERPNDLSSADAEVDRVLLTQHDAVFTLGTGSTLDNLRFDPKDAPFGEVVRTERGGEVTYHGPGQIVMYPIMNLRRYRQDIHWYLRALEETVIRTLAKLGLRGERVEGMTGVWVDGRKVAAVGVRVKRWVTMHGLSLNVRPNLEHFEHIVPCGIANRPVGSLEQLCDKDQDTSVERVGEILLESFEEVFRVSAVPPRLVPPPPPPPSEETLP